MSLRKFSLKRLRLPSVSLRALKVLCRRGQICCKDQLYRQISLFISFAKLTGIQSSIHIYYVPKLGISQLLLG